MNGGSLVRASLVRADEKNAVLALAVHHLLADRTSMQLIKRDLLALYEAACAEREAALPALSLGYGDFAACSASCRPPCGKTCGLLELSTARQAAGPGAAAQPPTSRGACVQRSQP
ncbi:condensation domain-containing protein [Pseudomonas sp. PCH446]